MLLLFPEVGKDVSESKIYIYGTWNIGRELVHQCSEPKTDLTDLASHLIKHISIKPFLNLQ